jgi:hypothetical protein
VGEDAARAAAEPPLFGQQRPGIQAGGVEKRQLLVVAGLVARVLAVAHEHGPVLLVTSFHAMRQISSWRMAVAIAKRTMRDSGMIWRGLASKCA